MTKPVVVVDMDSTLVDLMGPWLRAYNEDHGDNLTLGVITDWDTSKFVKPECGQKIFEYLRRPGFYLNLPPIPGAIEALEYLSERVEVHIATDNIGLWGSAEDKLVWLKKYLPWLGTNIHFGPNKAMLRADVFIEDGPKYIVGIRNQELDESRRPALIVGLSYGYNRGMDTKANLVHLPPDPSPRDYALGWQRILDTVCNHLRLPPTNLVAVP